MCSLRFFSACHVRLQSVLHGVGVRRESNTFQMRPVNCFIFSDILILRVVDLLLGSKIKNYIGVDL